MAKKNPHRGSSFDDFLKQDGIFDQLHAKALKRAIAEQLEESMAGAKRSLDACATHGSLMRWCGPSGL